MKVGRENYKSHTHSLSPNLPHYFPNNIVESLPNQLLN
jgi:hypothetical protein